MSAHSSLLFYFLPCTSQTSCCGKRNLYLFVLYPVFLCPVSFFQAIFLQFLFLLQARCHLIVTHFAGNEVCSYIPVLLRVLLCKVVCIFLSISYYNTSLHLYIFACYLKRYWMLPYFLLVSDNLQVRQCPC